MNIESIAQKGIRRLGLSFFSAMFISAFFLVYPFIHQPGNMMSFDSFGYHLYLPMLFIHDDLGMDDLSPVQEARNTYGQLPSFYVAHKSPLDNWLIRYTPGVAIMNSPFFLAAHTIAKDLGYKADGFSKPYQVAIVIGWLFYLILAVWALRWSLLRFYNDKSVAISLFLLFFSTNLLYYLGHSYLGVHGYSFFLISSIIFFTIKWHRNPGVKSGLGLGIALGLLVNVRPTDGLAFLIPLLWPLKDHAMWGAKIKMIFSSYRKELVAVLLPAIILGFITPLYWKLYAGSFIYDSYNNPGEGLDLFNPHIFSFLFSFRKGWLIYTPIMLFTLVGFYFLFRRYPKRFLPLALSVMLMIWVFSSWTVWWYSGSFGQRAMLEVYPIMLIPLTAGVAKINSMNTLWKSVSIGFIGLCLLLNIWQSLQYYRSVIHDSRMTAEYYFSVFFDWEIDPKKQEMLHKPYRDPAVQEFNNRENYRLYKVFEQGMESSQPPGGLQGIEPFEGKGCHLLNPEKPFSPSIKVKFDELTNTNHAWLIISAWIYPTASMDNVKSCLVSHLDHNGNYGYSAPSVSDFEDLQREEWNYIEYTYLTPHPRSYDDELIVYGWFQEGAPVYIDELKVKSYVPKGKS